MAKRKFRPQGGQPKPEPQGVKLDLSQADTMKCEDCGSDNLHWLAWVDKDKKYVDDAHQSQNGEYWCENCQENKE